MEMRACCARDAWGNDTCSLVGGERSVIRRWAVALPRMAAIMIEIWCVDSRRCGGRQELSR